ncbi:meiosis-specific transcription factor ndt80 [Agyrium rufum]|nr:meiosis-specific transcription factor ndt80 [Agyrium rufum]
MPPRLGRSPREELAERRSRHQNQMNRPSMTLNSLSYQPEQQNHAVFDQQYQRGIPYADYSTGMQASNGTMVPSQATYFSSYDTGLFTDGFAPIPDFNEVPTPTAPRLYPSNHPPPPESKSSLLFFHDVHMLGNLRDSRTHESLRVGINPEVHKGFFQERSIDKWTSYRRNYFSLTLSCAIDTYGHSMVPPNQGASLSIQFQPDEKTGWIDLGALAVTIKAYVHDSPDTPVDIVQHTAKRDKGPTGCPPMIPIDPYRSFHEMASGNEPIPRGVTHHSAFFDRLQFKKATTNNGRRRSNQQYFVLEVILCHHRDGSWDPIAKRTSSKIVVRGRSPGHYKEQAGSRGRGRENGHGSNFVPNFGNQGGFSQPGGSGGAGGGPLWHDSNSQAYGRTMRDGSNLPSNDAQSTSSDEDDHDDDDSDATNVTDSSSRVDRTAEEDAVPAILDGVGEFPGLASPGDDQSSEGNPATYGVRYRYYPPAENYGGYTAGLEESILRPIDQSLTAENGLHFPSGLGEMVTSLGKPVSYIHDLGAAKLGNVAGLELSQPCSYNAMASYTTYPGSEHYSGPTINEISFMDQQAARLLS